MAPEVTLDILYTETTSVHSDDNAPSEATSGPPRSNSNAEVNTGSTVTSNAESNRELSQLKVPTHLLSRDELISQLKSESQRTSNTENINIELYDPSNPETLRDQAELAATEFCKAEEILEKDTPECRGGEPSSELVDSNIEANKNSFENGEVDALAVQGINSDGQKSCEIVNRDPRSTFTSNIRQKFVALHEGQHCGADNLPRILMENKTAMALLVGNLQIEDIEVDEGEKILTIAKTLNSFQEADASAAASFLLIKDALSGTENLEEVQSYLKNLSVHLESHTGKGDRDLEAAVVKEISNMTIQDFESLASNFKNLSDDEVVALANDFTNERYELMLNM